MIAALLVAVIILVYRHRDKSPSVVVKYINAKIDPQIYSIYHNIVIKSPLTDVHGIVFFLLLLSSLL